MYTSPKTLPCCLFTASFFDKHSYAYVVETQLYYLQSRYYNPEIGRFINADGLASTGQGFLGNNMFAYCLNNPTNFSDSNGMSSHNAAEPWNCVCSSCMSYLNTMYDVPLYYQGNTNLCWAYCTIMTEDFRNGITRSDRGAFLAARDLAVFVHGEDNWNRGFHPLNCAKYTGTGKNRAPVETTDIDTFIDLALHLKENGPIYAVYESINPNKDGKRSRHVIVVTGIDYSNNRIYTNNTNNKLNNQGYQSYEEFLQGFSGAKASNPYRLICYYILNEG